MQDKEKGSVEASEQGTEVWSLVQKKSQVEIRGRKGFSPSTIVQGKAHLAIGSKSLTLKFSAFEEMFFSSWSAFLIELFLGPNLFRRANEIGRSVIYLSN